MVHKQPMRLPPLRTLRVRNPNKSEKNPCITAMSTVLACWASAGYTAAGCAALEQTLRDCVDAPPPPKRPSNTINYHLKRMQRKIAEPAKRDTPRA